jgi:hypothetical protein
VESKSDDLDFFDIPGYELKMENRKKVAKVNPGGITIAVTVSYNSLSIKY